MQPEAHGAEHRVSLPDERALGYAEFGSPEASPLLFFHGMPGSRLHGRMLDAAARAHGLRVIAVDRPGIGLSEPQPARRIGDWPADVTALTDALGLERFAVVATSAGGPYALACAHQIPERLTGVAVVSGLVPTHTRVETAETGNRAVRLHQLSARAPWMIRPLVNVIAVTARRSPEACLKRMMQSAADADRALLTDPEMFDLVNEGGKEAFLSGSAAVAHDMRLVTGEWGFPLERITAPVTLWHGDDDRTAPLAAIQSLAEHIPGCRCHVIPRGGHLLAFERMHDVLADLVTYPER